MVSSYNLDVSKIKIIKKNIRYEIIFQLFKFWFGQLDSDNLKYAECGNIQPDSWQLMNAAEVVEQEVVNRAVEKEVIADLLVQSGEKKNKKTYKN